MKTKTILLTILFLTTVMLAQEETKKDTIPQNTWIPAGVAGLNLSQISLSNWTQGGEDALSFVGYGNFGLNYYTNPWGFVNTLKLAVGKTKLGDQEFRTTDNEIFLENLVQYEAGWFAKPYFSNTFRSVILPGYDYSGDDPVQKSAFFDPGYFMQSFGLLYEHSKNFSTRLGFGLQETFTSRFTNYSDDVETLNELETFRFEAGVESVTKGAFQLGENLAYVSELRLFSAFDALDIWDVRWDNMLTAQINKYVNVNLNVLIVHDVDQTRKTQIKEALQIGLTYLIF
ncbi:MAG: DUF3078 domain-containing protein [Melioribacteraceae bacterium]